MKELLILFMLAVAYFVVCWPYAIVFSRAGYSKWLSLLLLIPLVNIALMWWFAHAEWTVADS
jgi:fucose permease